MTRKNRQVRELRQQFLTEREKVRQLRTPVTARGEYHG
jgi:hypothetical protein